MPEATWTRFVKRNNMNSRSVAWLRTIPLGDVDVYRSVFERATGRYIAEAGEIADAQLESTDSEDSDWDNPDIFDNDSESESINNIETPVPKRRRSTAAQQYRVRADPDRILSQDSLTTVDIPVQHTPRRRQDYTAQIFASTLESAASILAAPRLPGAEDVARASKDIQEQFAGEISDAEMVKCINHFCHNPMMAVAWNVLKLSTKRAFVNKWKKGGNNIEEHPLVPDSKTKMAGD